MNDSHPLRVGVGVTVLANPATCNQPDGIGMYTRALMSAYALRDDLIATPVVSGPRAARHAPAGTFVLPESSALSTAVSWATGAGPRGAHNLLGRIDVFHATDYRIPRLRGTPVCATLFDAIPLSHPEWANARLRGLKNLALRQSARWADHVIAISQAMVPELVEHYGIDSRNITVAHLGVDARWFERELETRIAEFRSRHGLRPGYLLFVGTLQPRKNVERIIAAFERLPAQISDRRQLVIAGKAGWRVEELVSKLRTYRTGGDVRWLEYVEDDDMRALYQGAAGFVFPSLHEGFGMPVLEAFASGVPVVTSNTTSLPEVAGEAAILVNPLDIDALAQGMASIIDNTVLAGRLRAAGLERARQFTWERCAAETIDVLRSLC